jgi:hypothetical protein
MSEVQTENDAITPAQVGGVLDRQDFACEPVDPSQWRW